MHQLKWLIWHITNHCNLTCDYCLTSSSPAEPVGRGADLAHLADLVAEHGPSLVTIIGGEPFTLPLLPEVVNRLTRAGCRVNIDTNGMFVRHRWSSAYEHGDVKLTVSLDGPSSMHETFRGSAKGVTAGVQFLLQKGARVACSVTATRANIDHLPEAVLYAAGLGFSEISVNLVRPLGRGARGGVRPTTEQVARAGALLATSMPLFKAQGLEVSTSGFYEPSLFALGSHVELPLCMCATWKATLWTDGRLYPCESMPLLNADSGRSVFEGVNLETDIRSALATSVFDGWRRQVSKPPDCQSCSFRLYCSSGCRAQAAVLSGDVTVRDYDCVL